jgi:putative endonuclease
MTTRELGQKGEQLAAEWLEAQGYTIFDRNYIFEKGELDLVAFIPNELVFVEVKTRTLSPHYDQPYAEASIDERKQALLFRTAEAYLYERQLTTIPARFDVIIIELQTDGETNLIHHPNALQFVSRFKPRFR